MESIRHIRATCDAMGEQSAVIDGMRRLESNPGYWRGRAWNRQQVADAIPAAYPHERDREQRETNRFLGRAAALEAAASQAKVEALPARPARVRKAAAE